MRGLLRGAVVRLDRADDPARALPARLLDDRAEHIGCGGLSLGARDANDGQVTIGVAERRSGCERHGRAQVVRDERGRLGRDCRELVRVRAVAEVGNGPGIKRLGEKLWLERRPLAHEEVSGRDRPRVA